MDADLHVVISKIKPVTNPHLSTERDVLSTEKLKEDYTKLVSFVNTHLPKGKWIQK